MLCLTGVPGAARLFYKTRKVVISVKIQRILAAAFAFCLLLSGCAADVPPVETTQPEIPETTATQPTEQTVNQWEQILTYAEYLEMTAEERTAFSDSFEDSAQFFEWFREVKAIYEEQRKENEMNQGGIIDMDQIDPNN